MNDHEQAILRTLDEMDEVVKRMTSTGPKPDLRPLFARLDELANRLPPNEDPELKHFLQRKSYQKARERLEGRAVAAGGCRNG